MILHVLQLIFCKKMFYDFLTVTKLSRFLETKEYLITLNVWIRKYIFETKMNVSTDQDIIFMY